jgi:hypothetical protein
MFFAYVGSDYFFYESTIIEEAHGQTMQYLEMMRDAALNSGDYKLAAKYQAQILQGQWLECSNEICTYAEIYTISNQARYACDYKHSGNQFAWNDCYNTVNTWELDQLDRTDYYGEPQITSSGGEIKSDNGGSNDWPDPPSQQLGTGAIMNDSRLVCGVGTIPKDGKCVSKESIQTQIDSKTKEGGGCLIATATYGSEMATEVQQLRELRDNQLMNTESGIQFMGMFNDIYYSFSPIIADYERENPLFKEAVKLAITPMISTLSIMENANSESEVLSIGISVIMLNIGMYLAVPAIVVIGIRKIR